MYGLLNVTKEHNIVLFNENREILDQEINTLLDATAAASIVI